MARQLMNLCDGSPAFRFHVTTTGICKAELNCILPKRLRRTVPAVGREPEKRKVHFLPRCTERPTASCTESSAATLNVARRGK
jgi:hypothetical protein